MISLKNSPLARVRPAGRRASLATLAALTAFAVTPAIAQAQAETPSASSPGLGLFVPQSPVEPAEAARRLEKRTDVANAQLPPLAQAVKETKKAPAKPPQAGGPKPPGPKPAGPGSPPAAGPH